VDQSGRGVTPRKVPRLAGENARHRDDKPEIAIADFSVTVSGNEGQHFLI